MIWVLQLNRSVFPFLLLLCGLSFWELSVRFYQVPHYILPTPTLIFTELIKKHVLLFTHTLVTLQEMLIGFTLAIAIAIPIAILMFQFRVLEHAFYPFIIGSQSVPVFAIAPLLILWFGYGIFSKVVMTTVIVFFPITLNTLDGLKSADPDMINMFRILKANRWQILWKVNFPAALPFIFSGAKIGISISTIGAVIGEWVGSKAGLGYLMLHSNSQMQIALVFAAIVCLTVMGLVLLAIMTFLEKIVVPWKVST
ncbi:ABC transporter permease [Candidatus Poribacteria bacterium]|nr:ABC transporter permease [Candidatus Poribacteria bacterium]